MKLELKTVLFSYVLFSSQLNITNCNGLVLCSETVSALQLCKREKSYKPNAIPKPTPRPIDIIGCPKITPCEKCLAPNAFSGAKFQV